jgi:Flp pilus assembly protein TadG
MTLRRDERAATAVEFAILVTPLIVLILASLQLSIIFYAGQWLQSAAVKSSRELMTGTSQQTNETQAQYHADVCKNAPVLFDCNSIMVDVESSSSYSSINTAPIVITYDSHGNPTNNFAYSTGNPGDIVILRVMYSWPVVASQLLPGLANQSNGNHLLVGTAVFKTEPY